MIFRPSNTEVFRRQILQVSPNTRPDLSSRLAKRQLHHQDHGARRLSEFWAPTGGIAPTSVEDSHALLVRAGFVRQTHSGIFQLLPLGLRVQEKLERLIDKHMLRLGASKVSLSTLSSEELWRKSGRLDKSNQELFRLQDRKGAKLILSPTHEEEITSLVGDIVKSYKDLPLRLYQVSRKYRDEKRPRQGLLRGREFLMKDLYTFDTSSEEALATYHNVRQAYDALLTELKVPYLVAEADSGNIGGDLSHEYHLPSDHGEDSIISCSECGYAVNEELTGAQVVVSEVQSDPLNKHGAVKSVGLWRGIVHDRSTIIEIAYPKTIEWTDDLGHSQACQVEVSTAKIKYLLPEVDLSIDLSSGNGLLDSDSNYESLGHGGARQILKLNDYRISDEKCGNATTNEATEALSNRFKKGTRLNFIKPVEDDKCPKCSSRSIKVTKAFEIGHTFHLGTRYSEPLGLCVVSKPSQQPHQESKTPQSAQQEKTPLQMGCHGLGISRMIAAIASTFADSKGLNWPTMMAPFQVVIVAGKEHEAGAITVFERLTSNLSTPKKETLPGQMGTSTIDVIVDDREKNFVWKMNDADLIGYPVLVLLGRSWAKERSCELQCRRLNVKKNVPLDDLHTCVRELLDQL